MENIIRKDLYLVLDIESANTLEDALFYDIGFAVADRYGHIYEKHSYINSDVFFGCASLMQSAYYAEKLPQYYIDIVNGTRKVANTYTIRQKILEMFAKYPIKAVCAYNAFFDNTSLNTTQRYITKSKYRYFLPYGVKIFDIWNMACQVICPQKKYYNFCIKNGFVSKNGNISTSAETVYRFLTNNINFDEEHRGLEDVLIETEIMAQCYKKHKKMNRKINRACWRLAQRKKGK